MPRRTFLAALLGGSALFAAAAQGSSESGPESGAKSNEAEVMIDNFTFSPAEATVAAGTRVTWTNRDDIPHTVTDAGAPRRFKSTPLDTGDSFAFTFDRPGLYRYFCSLHPHMQGTVVVR